MKKILTIFLLLCASALFAQSLLPINAPFVQGKPLQFSYSGGTGAATDWIGIYQKGQTPGSVSSTVWQYIPAKTGTVEFAGSLPPGNYDAHLFCCDGYQILASHLNFQVGVARLRSRLVYYKTSDSLRFSILTVAAGDRVAVFQAADFSNGNPIAGAVAVAEKIFSNAFTATTVSFFQNILPGKYVAVLQAGNGQTLGFEEFEIKPATVLPPVLTRLGIGSCALQSDPEPTLGHILTHNIEAFIFMGDNVYIDTYNLGVLQSAYENMLTTRTEYQKLRASVPILATWDDHDYGCCDEDKDYPLKVRSQKIFLDFFEEPVNSPRRTRAGIHTEYFIGPAGQKLQIILLDSRYFEDNKRPNNGCGKNDYCAWAGPGDTDKTMLGSAQWQWLKNVFLEPADLRLMVSSVQFSSSYHGFEGWSLFPYERKRMQELIKETHAEHVFFISGDMHYSEVSKLENDPGLYPIYDFTASAINESWPPEINENRVGNKAYGEPNVGLIDIDWANRQLTYSNFDDQNALRFAHTVLFSEMEFKTDAAEIPDSEKGLTLRQMPSPGQGSARLIFNKKTKGKASIFNADGKLVQQITVRNADVLEIKNLVPGIYVVKFQGEKGQTANAKVLVE